MQGALIVPVAGARSGSGGRLLTLRAPPARVSLPRGPDAATCCHLALAATATAATLAQRAHRGRRPVVRRATATLERVDEEISEEGAKAATPEEVAKDEAVGDAVLGQQVVDEGALLAKSTFPIKPDDLIAKCKGVLSRSGMCEADLADGFEFCAPFVGPLGKDSYLGALKRFKIEDAFPDVNPNYHFFRVDPFEPSRVWFNTRKMATHTEPFMGKPATGKSLEFPPETYSMDFDEQGLVKEFTVGYVVNRRVGNTGGLGGAFGFFYGVGIPLPFPEGRPYKPSWQFRFMNFIGRLQKRFQKKF